MRNNSVLFLFSFAWMTILLLGLRALFCLVFVLCLDGLLGTVFYCLHKYFSAVYGENDDRKLYEWVTLRISSETKQGT